MKREQISVEELKGLLRYDPMTGNFTRLVTTAPHKGRAGDLAGTINHFGHVVITLRCVRYRAHRLAWLYMTSEWPSGEIDHRNGIPSDNRWENLRDVTTQINAQNKRRAMSNSKTGLLGASWNAKDKKFTARLKVEGKYLSLGNHATAADAHAAYVNAKRRLHAGCTI